MKFKNSAAAFLVMCLLVGALILVKKREEDKSKTLEASNKIVAFEPDRIDQIKLKNSKGDFLFIKGSGQWKIIEPVNAEPDPAFIPDLLAKLEKLESKRDFEVKEQDLPEFGFDEPEFTLEIAHGKDRTEKLSFGIKAPGENTQYARLNDSLKVRLAETSLSDLNAKALFDMRNKDVIKFPRDEVRQILIGYPNTKEQYAIEKKGKGFAIEEPINAAADQSEIDRFLNGLLGVQANEYPAEDYLKSPEKWGFTKPFASITVTLNDGSSRTLLLGKESRETKGLFVTNPELKLVALTDDSLKKNLTVTLNSLIDKKLADWPDDAEIVKLETVSNGSTTTIEKKNDLWMIPSLKDFADQNIVSGLLSRIKYLRAQEFLTAKPLPEHGFDSPSLALKAFSKEGKELGRISFGKILAENKALVRGGADDFIFKIDDSFLNNAKSDIKKIRNKKPSLLKRFKINKMEFSAGSGSATFMKNGPDWSVSIEGKLEYGPAKEKISADSKKLLDFLTADKITAFVDAYDPKLSGTAFGFDKPLANITVWDDTSSEEKITIGKKDSGFAFLKRSSSEPIYKTDAKDIEDMLDIFNRNKKEGTK